LSSPSSTFFSSTLFIMKTLLTLLSAGVLGLIIGGIPGYLTGQPIGVESGKIGGVCAIADAAVQAKVLTLDQVAQLGAAMPTRITASQASAFATTPDNGEGCKRAVAGMVQGTN
jgi:hypothetical protein